MKAKIIVILILKISMNYGQKGEISMPKTECTYSCKNYVELALTNITRNQITKIDIKVQKTVIDGTLKMNIMTRQKYWNVLSINFGEKPISVGVKLLLPKLEEAKEWAEKAKCKIGEICPPNGDCWASWADKCYSDEATNWVDGRKMQFKNMQWSTNFHQTCTKDWECEIIIKESPLHFTSEGKIYVVKDDEKLFLYEDQRENYFEFSNYVIYLPKLPVIRTESIILSCFKHNEDLLCESKEDELSYLLFEKDTKCTVLGSTKYCLTGGTYKKVRDFGATKYASIADLNQVRDAFIVNEEKDNYNIFILEKKILKIQKIILNLLSQLTENNPNILNKILNGNFFVRNLDDFIFEICPCRNIMDCKTKEFHHTNVQFCPPKRVSSRINIFGNEEQIDYSVDEKFNFQGKDIHVESSIVEKEEAFADYSINNDNEHFWGSLTSAFDVFSNLKEILVYVSLGLSIFNFLRR